LKRYLDESNFLGVATEALPAAHQTILPDDRMRVSANPAVQIDNFRSKFEQK